MNSLTLLLKHFGFTVRELADFLGFSHAFFLQIKKGTSRLPAWVDEMLQHPLFSEMDTQYEPGSGKETETEEWLRAKWNLAKEAYRISKTKAERLEKKILHAKRIVHHTRHLNQGQNPDTDLTVVWWQWQRGKAELFLKSSKPGQLTKLQMNQHLARAEMAFWEEQIRNISGR